MADVIAILGTVGFVLLGIALIRGLEHI